MWTKIAGLFSKSPDLKSTEVYSLLRAEVGPWFKEAGFKRVKQMLGWSRPHGDKHVVVWFQVSQDGWDAYAGSKFVVELQHSAEPRIGGHPNGRRRMGELLTPQEREEVRAIQNRVISALRRPPSNHPLLRGAPDLAKYYRAKFKTVDERYSENEDIWFRYAAPEHVTQWARYIREKLPRCIADIERL